MPLTPALQEALTGAVVRDASFVNAAVWLSSHSANPGSSGANELTSGTGAAGRQNLTFTSGGSGDDTNNLAAAIAVPGAQTIPWVGFWTAQVGGTFLGGWPLISYPYLTAVGLTGSDLIYCPANDLSIGDKVRLFTIPNGQSAIPTGLAGDPSVYFVIATPTVDELVLSATHGGSAISLSGSGGFFLAEDATQVFSSGGGIMDFSIGNVQYATVS